MAYLDDRGRAVTYRREVVPPSQMGRTPSIFRILYESKRLSHSLQGGGVVIYNGASYNVDVVKLSGAMKL